jgi:hypothetical protein
MLRKWPLSGRGDQNWFWNYRSIIPDSSFLLLQLEDPSSKYSYQSTNNVKKSENWRLSTTLTWRGSMWEKAELLTSTDFHIYTEAILLGFCGIFAQQGITRFAPQSGCDALQSASWTDRKGHIRVEWVKSMCQKIGDWMRGYECARVCASMKGWRAKLLADCVTELICECESTFKYINSWLAVSLNPWLHRTWCRPNEGLTDLVGFLYIPSWHIYAVSSLGSAIGIVNQSTMLRFPEGERDLLVFKECITALRPSNLVFSE